MAYTRRIQMLLYDTPCGLSLLEMVLNILQVSAIGIAGFHCMVMCSIVP